MMRPSQRLVLSGFVGLALVLGLGACEKPGDSSRQSPPATAETPAPQAGRPQAPFAGGSQEDAGPTDDHALPVKLTGNNSLQELEEGKAAAGSPETAALFEEAYRKTFTADQSKRDYAGAAAILEAVISARPDFPYAYRAMGYARFNMGFQVDAAYQNYNKAIELKPDYGEAYYALAFLSAMNDRETGARMFRKAMELGVPDERKLGERFYPGK